MLKQWAKSFSKDMKPSSWRILNDNHTRTVIQNQNQRREQIIKGVQDSYAMSGEPVDAKATVAKAQDKAEELKDKILEGLKLND